MAKTSSYLVSTYSLTADHLSLVPATVAYSGSRQLASARSLYRDGRDVVEMSLSRPLVKLFADLNTACLRHSKRATKARGGGDYQSRSMGGMAGELGLHFLAKMLGLPARLTMPSLFRQPIDHRMTVGSQELAIQSKTRLLRDGNTVNKIYGKYKFFVDPKDDGLDYYSFAVIPEDELYADTECITLDLFAFVPVLFIQRHAIVDRTGRYITYEDLQASSEAMSHVSLDGHDVLPQSMSVAADSYKALTSRSVEDRIIEALLLVDATNDGLRVLDMVTGSPSLLRTLEAGRSSKGLKASGEHSPKRTCAQSGDSAYVAQRSIA